MITKVDILHLQMITDLEKQLFHEGAYSYEEIVQMNNDPNYWIYVSCDQDKNFYGYLILLDLKTELEIIKIGVSPQSQGKGIGSELMNHAKSFNLPIFLEVSAKNTKAINFYEYHQFQKISERPHYYHDGSDAIILKYTKE